MICVGCREPHRPEDCEDSKKDERLYRSCGCLHRPREGQRVDDAKLGESVEG